MGREAYLMRLALGLSAFDPPEDSQTFTAVRASEWSSAVHAPGGAPPSEATVRNARQQPPPQNVQLYDARGHPFNPWARLRSRRLREAQNDILSVIGVTERKIPADHDIDINDPNYKVSGHEVDSDEDAAGDFIGNAADFDFQFISWWIHALTNRLLVLPPTEDLSFTHVVQLQWRTLGSRRFLVGGLPSFMLSHAVNPEMWTGFVLYFIDRAVMASISSRGWRDTYTRMRPVLAGSIEVILNVFVLPFRLHSMLQLLGFAPESTFLSLPHPRSWIPFCGTSLIQWSWDVQPLLPFFAFRPLSSLVHQYLFMSCRPAIMEPVDSVHRRRSSGARFAYSVNSAPLIELPNEETTLTGLYKRLFNFLRWGHPSYTVEKPDLPFNPGLRRRETWPPSTSADTEIESPAPDAGAIPPLEAAAGQPTTLVDIPLLHRTQTAMTIDNSSPIEHDHDGISDATIRVSSIDPDTGAVNLEIGLPDETLLEHETSVDHNEESDGDATMDSSATRHRRDLELFQKPHHVSRLALEPTELLASMANGWVAGWLLMPLRVMVLRGLVRHVVLKPELFGVSPARARALPSLLGSDMSVLAPGKFAMSGVKHIGLSCLIDVSLGLGFWLTEWAVVRAVGVRAFNWGTF